LARELRGDKKQKKNDLLHKISPHPGPQPCASWPGVANTFAFSRDPQLSPPLPLLNHQICRFLMKSLDTHLAESNFALFAPHSHSFDLDMKMHVRLSVC